MKSTSSRRPGLVGQGAKGVQVDPLAGQVGHIAGGDDPGAGIDARLRRSGSLPRAWRNRIVGLRRRAMGPTTEGYSLASMQIELPSRQSRLSATIETPSATLLTKPMSARSTPHKTRDAGAGVLDFLFLRDAAGQSAAFVGHVAQQGVVMRAQGGGFATGADMGDASGHAEIGRVEEWAVHAFLPA